jgi:hypothetical protein
MSASAWVVVLKAVNSPVGQWVRRWLAKRSAAELRRRENAKQADDIARRNGDL